MRNKRKKDKVLRIFIVLIILIIGIYFGYNKLLNNHNNISSDSKVNVDDNNHSTSISLIMAGDNLINDKLYNAAKRMMVVMILNLCIAILKILLRTMI